MKKWFVVSVVAFLICAVMANTAYAASDADHKYSLEKEVDISCSAGGAHDQIACLDERLKQAEKEMKSLIERSVNEYKSMWGEAAVLENKKRVLDAQENWEAYKDGHCRYGYYREAPAHPASQELTIVGCLLDKTTERVREIKKEYLHIPED